ncbi:MAG TPA: histidine phosphatase family protein [Clostridia bacterium]|jgi:broad specificity phosphatase PhoE|nr:MAG: putative phosphoserine phosphatase 2 [Firmicutes bacterium ADurb.Bin146]HOD92399.1 histidine phosphatase family protein [Clostridia bacterium]HQM38604.1 histidine phosphatase family protein [Clostridia bacterium]
MRILLIRHGQTDWNIQDKVQGSSDIPLNETGIQQAYATKDMLKDYVFDIVISSPLIRAYQTADIVCEGRENVIVTDGRISERDFGKFEGVSYKQNMEYRKGAWSLKMDEQLDTVEAYPLFYKRVEGFLDEILKVHYGKDILLVAHGGVSIAVGQYFRGIPQSGLVHEYILDNCEIAEYSEVDINKKL